MENRSKIAPVADSEMMKARTEDAARASLANFSPNYIFK